MPSSAIESVPYLIEFIRKNRPKLKTVLDVGIGFGKDGFLLREYYDVKEWHNYQPETWQLKITGIEVFGGYVSSLQKLIYNKVILADVFKVLPGLGKFDLAILADVIEHFPKEKGYELLDILFEHVEDIVISTPNGFEEHHSVENNDYEEHKSGWTLEDFERYKIIDKAVAKRIRKDQEILVVYLRKT